MFTGIIQALGKIKAKELVGDALRLEIEVNDGFADFVLGESIAVMGICLTVESFTKRSFKVFLSKETIALSNLGSLRIGDLVNLEKALKLSDSMSGHFVSGHVDATCQVLEIIKQKDCTETVIELPDNLAMFIAKKGSVTLNGVSLTINSIKSADIYATEMSECFLVNLIPHTIASTTFSKLVKGEKLNLEVDLVARYLARMQHQQRA